MQIVYYNIIQSQATRARHKRQHMRLKSSRVQGSELSGDTRVQEYMTIIIVHIIRAEEKVENQSVITCRC